MVHGIRKGGLTAHGSHLPHLGSTLGLTLLSGMQVRCPEDVRTAGLTTPPPCLPYGGMGKGKIPSFSPPPSYLWQMRRVDRVTTGGEPALSLISRSEQEGRHCAPLPQKARANPIVRKAGEPALRAGEQQSSQTPIFTPLAAI